MQTATVWLELNDLHDVVKKEHVTPAQAVMLRSQFGVKVEGESQPISPLVHVHINGEVARTASEEYSRLCKIYSPKVVKDSFPGDNPRIPMTFAEVGISETEDKSPKKGKEHDRVPLEKLALEEVIDPESAQEVAKRQKDTAEREELKNQVKSLQEQVQQLAGALTVAKQPTAPVTTTTPPPVSKK